MSSEAITLKTRDKIAIITLNLPKKLNALTQDLYYRLSCLMREVAARDDIYITILTGKGRYFSAFVPLPFPSELLTHIPHLAVPMSQSPGRMPKVPTSGVRYSKPSFPTTQR